MNRLTTTTTVLASGSEEVKTTPARTRRRDDGDDDDDDATTMLRTTRGDDAIATRVHLGAPKSGVHLTAPNLHRERRRGDGEEVRTAVRRGYRRGYRRGCDDEATRRGEDVGVRMEVMIGVRRGRVTTTTVMRQVHPHRRPAVTTTRSRRGAPSRGGDDEAGARR